MSENVMLQEAIDAIRQGQRARARDLLTRLLRIDQSNSEYWVWMSAVVDTVKEQIYCLQSALRLDSGNRTARQGLVLLGALSPEPDMAPVPPVRRSWVVAEQEVPGPRGFQKVWANPALRVLVFAALLLVVGGLIAAGIFGFGQSKKSAVALRPTKTPGPPPTFTTTPTMIARTRSANAVFVTPSPTFAGPTPLWMLLEATYTPTPIYVNTPHPVSEAFRSAQRARQRGDLAATLRFLQQALQVDPNAADIQYTIGEIYREQGEYEQALQAYNLTIEMNENFGPAYLGRARATVAQNPKANIAKDLDLAIEKDPAFGEAFLARAEYRLAHDQAEDALSDLEQAAELLPDSPLVFLYRGQAELNQEDLQAALEDANRAMELDKTSLPTYLLLGQVALANAEYETALEALSTYLTYQPESTEAWLASGQADYELGRYTDALAALDQAIQLDDKRSQAYLFRGLTYLEMKEGQPAINDLLAAHRANSRSFAINLGLGRALYLAERLNEANNQLKSTEDLAQSDEEKAQVYYWRAQVLEAQGSKPLANQMWKALLALPKSSAPADWISAAKAYLAATATPTITASPTATARPTKTPTPTAGNPIKTTPTPPTATPTPTKR